MTEYTTGLRAVQDAAARVLNGSVGERTTALILAVFDLVFFHPASWLIVMAGVLSVIDWMAGREKAKAEGRFEVDSAKAGLSSKMLSWVLLLVIWFLTLILIRLASSLPVDLQVTWILPVFFTIKFMLEEVRSIYENLDQPRWLQPLIDFLEGITKSLALRQPKPGGDRD